MPHILYIGDDSPASGSLDRALALRRVGHEVEILNPRNAYKHLRVPAKVHHLSGYLVASRYVHPWLLDSIGNRTYDIIWINQRADINPNTLGMLKTRAARTVVYINDDPTGSRDFPAWTLFNRGIKVYDICFVVRGSTELELMGAGATRCERVWMTYDELRHSPLKLSEIDEKFRSEIAFIGTWMHESGSLSREKVLLRLIQAGLNVSIWGNRWSKSRDWSALKNFWRGSSLSGNDYRSAIGGAGLCLGFLSQGNRDLHTSRSSEIPFAGGLLCAQRTSEHQMMYRQDIEALFWDDAEDCIRRCREILRRPDQASAIREAGRRRVIELGLGNERLATWIVETSLTDRRTAFFSYKQT